MCMPACTHKHMYAHTHTHTHTHTTTHTHTHANTYAHTHRDCFWEPAHLPQHLLHAVRLCCKTAD